VEDTPPPNLQPEHQEKGHSFHALSSVGGRPAHSGLPLCFRGQHAEDFEKTLNRLAFLLF
jgi:hypothetical protein